MRTTLTIDDDLLDQLKRRALETGKPFKDTVNDALRAGIRETSVVKPRPYRLQPASLGHPRGGLDLDRALHIAQALEEEALAEKLEQRK